LTGAEKKIVAPILIRAGITVVTTQARCIFIFLGRKTTPFREWILRSGKEWI